ncbi:MAG: hypothetical protein SGILL_004803 [Bacillariaceae sp.]
MRRYSISLEYLHGVSTEENTEQDVPVHTDADDDDLSDGKDVDKEIQPVINPAASGAASVNQDASPTAPKPTVECSSLVTAGKITEITGNRLLKYFSHGGIVNAKVSEFTTANSTSCKSRAAIKAFKNSLSVPFYTEKTIQVDAPEEQCTEPTENKPTASSDTNTSETNDCHGEIETSSAIEVNDRRFSTSSNAVSVVDSSGQVSAISGEDFRTGEPDCDDEDGDVPKDKATQALGEVSMTATETENLPPQQSLRLQLEQFFAQHHAYTGLANFGDSCFVNAALQFLFAQTQFMAGLVGEALRRELRYDTDYLPEQGYEILQETLALYGALSLRDSRPASAHRFKQMIDTTTDMFLQGRPIDPKQHCAAEFCHHFLGVLHDVLNKGKKEEQYDDVDFVTGELRFQQKYFVKQGRSYKITTQTPIKSGIPMPTHAVTDTFFHMEFEEINTCMQCKFKRSMRASGKILEVHIHGHNSFDSALNAVFQPEETECLCPQCGCTRNEKQRLFLKQPNALILQFMRFKLKSGGQEYTKIHTPIDLVLNLTLKPSWFSTKAVNVSPNTTYPVQSVLYHRGGDSPHSGHYLTVGRRNADVVEYNDSVTKVMTEEEWVSSKEKKRQSYMIMCRRDEGGVPAPVVPAIVSQVTSLDNDPPTTTALASLLCQSDKILCPCDDGETPTLEQSAMLGALDPNHFSNCDRSDTERLDKLLGLTIDWTAGLTLGKQTKDKRYAFLKRLKIPRKRRSNRLPPSLPVENMEFDPTWDTEEEPGFKWNFQRFHCNKRTKLSDAEMFRMSQGQKTNRPVCSCGSKETSKSVSLRDSLPSLTSSFLADEADRKGAYLHPRLRKLWEGSYWRALKKPCPFKLREMEDDDMIDSDVEHDEQDGEIPPVGLDTHNLDQGHDSTDGDVAEDVTKDSTSPDPVHDSSNDDDPVRDAKKEDDADDFPQPDNDSDSDDDHKPAKKDDDADDFPQPDNDSDSDDDHKPDDDRGGDGHGLTTTSTVDPRQDVASAFSPHGTLIDSGGELEYPVHDSSDFQMYLDDEKESFPTFSYKETTDLRVPVEIKSWDREKTYLIYVKDAESKMHAKRLTNYYKMSRLVPPASTITVAQPKRKKQKKSQAPQGPPRRTKRKNVTKAGHQDLSNRKIATLMEKDNRAYLGESDDDDDESVDDSAFPMTRAPEESEENESHSDSDKAFDPDSHGSDYDSDNDYNMQDVQGQKTNIDKKATGRKRKRSPTHPVHGSSSKENKEDEDLDDDDMHGMQGQLSSNPTMKKKGGKEPGPAGVIFQNTAKQACQDFLKGRKHDPSKNIWMLFPNSKKKALRSEVMDALEKKYKETKDKVYNGTKAECDAAGHTAASILGKGKKKKKLSLVHVTESRLPLIVLAGDSKPEMIHPLSDLVAADPDELTKVPAHRKSFVKRVQQKQEEGKALHPTSDKIHTESYWTPVPGVATLHAGASILKRKRLFMHFLLQSNPIYISCHQVPYGGLEFLKLFYSTAEGVPVDAIYESEYNNSGKLYRWKRVWVRPGNNNDDDVEWDKYMYATD